MHSAPHAGIVVNDMVCMFFAMTALLLVVKVGGCLFLAHILVPLLLCMSDFFEC